MGLGTCMARVGSDRATAAQPCPESRRCSKQCWERPALPVLPWSTSPGPALVGRAGPGGRVGAAAPPVGSSSPQHLIPSPWPGLPVHSQQGSSAFLRKPLLTAGDTATEYKKTHRHTHKDTPVRALRAAPSAAPCPAQGAS